MISSGVGWPGNEDTSNGSALACRRVTAAGGAPSVSGMAEWPYEQFNAYLERAMTAAGIKDREELSRLAGINPTQPSTWRSGQRQPTRDSLEKIAKVLDVPVATLLYMAGRAKIGDFETPPDVRVIPREFRRLLDLFFRAPESEQATLLSTLDVLAAGMHARMDGMAGEVEGRPIRRRAPRRTA